jgi:preprotein translocase subunit SecG
MFSLFLVLISIDAVLLIFIVLMQSGKGGGLAAEFGGASSSTDSFMGGRQAANFLTRSTWIGGGAFLAMALLLAVLSARQSAPPEPILRNGFGQTTPPTSVLDAEGQGEAAQPVPLEAPDQTTPPETGQGNPEEN